MTCVELKDGCSSVSTGLLMAVLVSMSLQALVVDAAVEERDCPFAVVQLCNMGSFEL